MAHIPPSDSPGAPARPGPSLSAPALPDAAAIVPARIGGGGKRNRWGALSVSADGEVEELGAEAALDLLAREAALVVHPAFTARRIALGLAGRQGFRAPGPKVLDLLELFAFVHPAAPCLPTPGGLARALGLEAGETPEAQATMLHAAAVKFVEENKGWETQTCK